MVRGPSRCQVPGCPRETKGDIVLTRRYFRNGKFTGENYTFRHVYLCNEHMLIADDELRRLLGIEDDNSR